MFLEVVIFVTALLGLALVAWFLWQPWRRGEEDLPETFLRPHSQEGFENLSAGDLHQVEDEDNERLREAGHTPASPPTAEP